MRHRRRGIVVGMTAVVPPPTRPSGATRRERAARTVDGALRSGVLAATVAAAGWLIAGALAATAFLLLVIGTVAAAIAAVARGRTSGAVWGALAVGWAIVLIEQHTVQSHGGLWVGAATWLGVIAGARRAGISRLALPLLAYPLACGAIAVAEHQSLLSPWGVSWLWVAAVLGPVVGARTVL